MIKRLKKYISLVLIIALLFGRVFSVLPVLAEDPTSAASQTLSIPPTIVPPVNNYAPPPTIVPPVNNYAPPPTIAPPVNPYVSTPTPVSNSNQPSPTAGQSDSSQTSSNVTPTTSAGNSGDSGTGNATGLDPLPTSATLDSYPTSTALSPLGDSASGVSGATGATGATGGSGSSVNDPANTNTGAGSTNAAEEKLKAQMETLNQNLAEINNKVNAINSTGFNYANMNSLKGQVFSGDSVSSLNLLNKLNSNMTGLGGFAVFNVYDSYAGDIVFKLADGKTNEAFANASSNVSKNAATGAGSNNIADSSNSFTVKEANGNDAKLNNDINLKSLTGNNTANLNTGDGNITTGDATALANIVNLANTNITVVQWLIGVVNVFGDLVGNILLPKSTATTNNTNTNPGVSVGNSNTGASSNNTANFTSDSTDSFQNANSAKVTSNVDVSANTGNNTSSVNTGGGEVKTGNSNASVSNSTIANQNTVDEEGTVWMVIVNEAGKWVGHIIGNPYGSTAASNALNVAQQKDGAGTQVYNAGTGAGSNNNSNYDQTANTTVTNNNTASITNNVTAQSDTGNNEATFNTGKGSIDTGNAKVGLNLVNMVNTNVVAKKFIAIFVNVIGSFVGDVVTPDQQASSTNNTVADSTTGSSNTVSATPTPTTAQIPSFNTDAGNIGGTEEVIVQLVSPTPFPTIVQQEQTVVNYTYYYYPETAADNGNVVFQPVVYQQAVSYFNNVKQKVVSQGQKFYQGPQLAKQTVENQISTLQRGIFMSPAFAKATQESSFAGMLLGGASFKVTESWLSIVPLAFIVFVIRRRRKFHLAKYINALLDIVL